MSDSQTRRPSYVSYLTLIVVDPVLFMVQVVGLIIYLPYVVLSFYLLFINTTYEIVGHFTTFPLVITYRLFIKVFRHGIT